MKANNPINLYVEDLYTGNAPFDDNKLEYDDDFHMYFITDTAINTEFETSVDEDELRDLSFTLYNFIYSFKTPERFDKMEFLLAHNKYYREGIYRALLQQYQYSKTSGGDRVQLQHGVNIDSGNVIPLKELRGELMVSVGSYLTLQRYGILDSCFRDGDDFDYTYYWSENGSDY